MRDRIYCYMVALALAVTLTACSADTGITKKAFTYSVGSNDKIRIIINDELSLSDNHDGTFSILKTNQSGNQTAAAEGSFYEADYFDTLHALAESSSSYSLLDDRPESFIYTVFKDGGWKTDCVVRPLDSDTSVVMYSSLDSEEAKDLYDKIVFSIVSDAG